MDTVINSFVEKSKEILQDNLVGVYLHGSAVMGCYNPAKSDIDLTVVVKESIEIVLGKDERKGFFVLDNAKSSGCISGFIRTSGIITDS